MAGASGRKRRRVLEAWPAWGNRRARVGPDRISALPDGVLRCVLSHLTSREAVQTSLLKRRWRHIWKSVPIIDVSFDEFEDRDGVDEIEREHMFKDFVDTLLERRGNAGLDEFRLLYSSSTGDSSAEANQWISHALQLKANTVKVVGCGEPIVLDNAVCYLKRLQISSARMAPGFFNQLQTSCPALEYLFLYDCGILGLENANNTLKVLILSEEVGFEEHASISAPSLISLSIEGSSQGCRLPILQNMASLETASVLFQGNTTDADAISQLLTGLSDVQVWTSVMGLTS